MKLDGRLKKLESQVAPERQVAEIDPDYWFKRVAEEGFTWDEMIRQFEDIPGFAYWLMCKPSEIPVSQCADPAEEYMRLLGK